MVSSRRQRLALLAVGLLLGLIASEIALRVGARWIFLDNFVIPDAELGWSLRPSYGGWATEENTVWVSINSAGFRDRERALVPAPGTRRVAVIGDSFIHGYFLPLEQSFPAVLERQLTSCTGGRVEALGFGALGYNTTQELLTYRLHAARYSPAVVIVAVFTLNDVFDNHPRLSTEPAPRYVFDGTGLALDHSFRHLLPAPSRWPWRRSAFEFLTTRWRTGQLVKMGIDRARDRAAVAEPDAGPAVDPGFNSIYQAPTLAEHGEAWLLTEAVLLKFAREVAANGSEFWIATLFNPEQVDPRIEHRQTFERQLGVEHLFYPDRRLAAFAKAHGIRVISLAEPIADYTAATGAFVNGGNSPLVPPGTGHWNEVGARIAADYSAAEICRGSAVVK
jgi:hypothetical protein